MQRTPTVAAASFVLLLHWEAQPQRRLPVPTGTPRNSLKALGACAVGKLTTICSGIISFFTTTYGV